MRLHHSVTAPGRIHIPGCSQAGTRIVKTASYAGHPRLPHIRHRQSWMAGPGPAMTQKQWPHVISPYFNAYAGLSGPPFAARLLEQMARTSRAMTVGERPLPEGCVNLSAVRCNLAGAWTRSFS